MASATRLAVFTGWLVLGIIWGTTWLFIKIGLHDLPPFTFAGLRFALAVLPLVCLVAWRREAIPRRPGDWLFMTGTGFLTITLNYGLVFWASQEISSGQTATLHATLPMFAILFAHFMVRNERMTLRRTAGVLLGILGVAVIFAEQLSLHSAGAILASVAVVVAALGTALSNVIVKRRCSQISPLLLATAQMLFGLFPLLAIGLLSEDASAFTWSPTAILCLLYLAWVGSALAFVLMFWLIQRMPVTLTQLTPFVSTVTAVALGVMVLGEGTSPRFLAGVTLVLGGVTASARGR